MGSLRATFTQMARLSSGWVGFFRVSGSIELKQADQFGSNLVLHLSYGDSDDPNWPACSVRVAPLLAKRMATVLGWKSGWVVVRGQPTRSSAVRPQLGGAKAVAVRGDRVRLERLADVT